MVCSLSLAILWQGELRRLMELLGTGRLAVLLGNAQKEFQASEFFEDSIKLRKFDEGAKKANLKIKSINEYKNLLSSKLI